MSWIEYLKINLNGVIITQQDLDLMSIKEVEKHALEASRLNEIEIMNTLITIAQSKRDTLIYEETMSGQLTIF